MFQFMLLGTAAGGGIPQWNCACAICTLSRSKPEIVPPRFHLQAAVWSAPDAVFLLNACPDIRSQIESHPELHPSVVRGTRNTPIQGIVLTGADLDQTIGLLLLREFQPLTVYATEFVRRVLEENSFFRMLQRIPNQLTWIEIKAGVPFALGSTSITCTPFELAGGAPAYVTGMIPRDSGGQISIGLSLKSGGMRIAYSPTLPAINKAQLTAYAGCQAIFVDGTFWSDAELSEIHAGMPRARDIGHVPMSGRDGTIALLSGISVPHKVFVHVNNTNPVLDPRSDQYKWVIDAGWQIGSDGWQLTMS